MADWLTNDQVNELIKALVEAQYYGPGARDALRPGLVSGFVGELKEGGSPVQQLRSDLDAPNRAHYLVEGKFPLHVWLTNASNQLSLQANPQANVFLRVRDSVN